MDEAFDLADYLPVFPKTPDEEEYLPFLWTAYENNYDGKNYHFAFLAYHLIMMSFVYFKIWQLRQISPDDFEKVLIGVARDDERNWLRDISPFTFSKVNERAVLRLFRLIGCDDGQIGNYRKLVDDRNNAAHANGNIFFQTQPGVDAKINQVLRAVEEIQTYFRPTIIRCYEEFLLQSRNPEIREYPDVEEQIREVLIRSNYMSRKDIEFCISVDISVLEHEKFGNIEALHRSLCETYGTENQDTQ